MRVMLNPVTDVGILGSDFEVSGPIHGHEDGSADASSEDIAEWIVIRVAALEGIIASRRAADRAKNHRALPYLEPLREIREHRSVRTGAGG